MNSAKCAARGGICGLFARIESSAKSSGAAIHYENKQSAVSNEVENEARIAPNIESKSAAGRGFKIAVIYF